MAIINVIKQGDGNALQWASANIESLVTDGNGLAYHGPGTQLQINVESFDSDGVSLGIQGLDFTVETSTPGYNTEVGGVRSIDLLAAFARVIRDSWSPGVRTTASQDTKKVGSFKVKPPSSDGSVVRIRDWVYVNQPLAPA